MTSAADPARAPADAQAPRDLPVERPVGIIGAGAIGAAIAQTVASAGSRVVLFDGDEVMARSAAQLVLASTPEAEGRVRVAESVDDLADCGLVIESGDEDLAAKRDMLVSVEKAVGDGVLLATNTSTSSVTVLGRALRRPARLVGMHFVGLSTTRVVEIVRGAATSPATVEAACAAARSWDRVPVVCDSTPGLVLNRVNASYFGEAQRLVEERAALPQSIDEVLRRVGGFPLGPFELSDQLGQDAVLATIRQIWEQTFHDQRYAPTTLQQRLVDAGWLGVSAGRGVYDYTDQGAGRRAAAPVAPTVPQGLHVEEVGYTEGFAVMEPLVQRIMDGGVRLRSVGDSDPECSDEVGLLLPSGGRVVETSGRRARDIGDEVVTLDWAFDAATTTQVAVAAAANCSARTLGEAIAILQAAQLDVMLVEDSPGLIVARTISMIINEAIDLVDRGKATARDIDVAMQLGLRYPDGPMTWGERIGPACVVAVLDALHEAVPTGRYRAAPALRYAADTGSPLLRNSPGPSIARWWPTD